MHILRVVALLIGLAACIVLGWVFVDLATQPDIDPATGQRRMATPPAEGDLRPVGRSAVEERIKLAPEHAAFFATLQRAFPQDYARILDGFAEKAVAASKLESADFYLTETVRAVRARHGVVASRAGAPALERVFKTQARLLAGLSDKDPRLCVDFLHGRASTGFFEFAAANGAVVAELAQAGLDAILDGQKTRAERQPPTDEDFARLEQLLQQRGMGRSEIEALLDGKTPDPPLPDVAMCRAGRVYLEVLEGLPEDARLRIYALAVELLART
jgi:hypothetical protein